MSVIFKKIWNAFDGLASDSLWAILFDVIKLISAIISFTLIQKILDTEKYGSFMAVFAIIAPLGALSYAGPGLAILKAIFRDRLDNLTTFRSYLTLSFFASLGLSVFGIVFALFITNDLNVFEISFLVLSELLAGSVIMMVASFLHATAGFANMTRVKIGMIAIKISLIFLLVVLDANLEQEIEILSRISLPFEKFEAFTILNLGLGYLVFYVLYAIWLLRVHLPKYGYKFSFKKPEYPYLRSGLIFGGPMAAGQFQSEGDKIVMEKFNADANEVGLYANAYKIISFGITPLRALNSAAFQRFLPDDESQKGLHLRRATRYTAFLFSASVAISAVLYLSLPLIDFLIDDNYKDARKMIPWLIPIIPLFALKGTPLNGLIGLDRTLERSYIYFASSMFSLIMYLIFIPPYGWKGAVAATLISEVFLAIVSWVAIIYYQRKSDQTKLVDEAAIVG